MSDDRKIIERAQRRLKLSQEADAKQRVREREDIEFQLPENQWPAAAKAARAGGEDGLSARPMLSISRIRQPMQLIKNQAQKAALGVGIDPVSETANEDLAEVIEDLYRRIQRDGRADIARLWALDRAVQCGRGWYRIVTCYDEDADPNGPDAWDQEIRYQRILHQDAVYPDPAAQEPDYSDGRFLFLAVWMSEDEFRAKYPDAKLAAYDSIDWEGIADVAPDWVRPGTDKPCLVVEYWEKEVERIEVKGPKGRKRYREKVTVFCHKIAAGDEILETTEWNGRYIPFVPLIGEELQPINGERRWQGVVRPARDAQQVYNYAITTAVEDISRLSKAPYVGYAEVFEGYENEWRSSNVRNYPMLRINRKEDGAGGILPPPVPMQIDGTKLQLSLAMAEHGAQMINAATAVHEPSLGELPQRRDAQSGRAILALQQQSDAGTSHFLQNMKDISLPYEARIILDLIPTIYDRPGRVARVLGGEDEARSIMLNKPFVVDPATGRPKPVPPRTPGAKVYDLRSAGRYAVAASIGKNPQTRMEAGQAFLTEIVSARPELMDVAGDLFFKFRDEPGAKELSERLKKIIQARNPTLFEDDQESPEALQAKIAALQQQAQQMGEQYQQAVQFIQTKQVEQQAKIEVARIQAEMDLKMQELRNVGAITVAQINAEAKGAIEESKARNEAAATGLEIVHEERMQDKEHAHEVGMAAAGGREVKMSRSAGRDDEQEGSREVSGGGSSERSEEDQPPQMEASE